jgi:predicted ATPase/class 3 adenylate cyclase
MGRPAGTVTFLFSDIEGSTQRWERDAEAMSAALRRHDALMRESIETHGGYIFKVIGDAFCAAFATAPEALAAAVRAQRKLTSADFSNIGGLRVRMALHTGQAEERDDDYFGPTVNRVARLLAIGHGGQVLASGTTADLLHDALPSEHELRDLGLHGLKDLSHAERVFQVLAPQLDDVFPALRSLEQLPNNLPAQLTSFVGREQEVAQIESLLEHSPLVTIAGTGGVGKTRCALQAGARLLEKYADGVWFVDLAPVSDQTLVTSTIARTLGVREAPNRPLIETLTEFLARQRLLLIVDNCEHVLAEARNAIVTIAHSCPDLRIVTTSREPLNVAGEQVLRLPSLGETESIALFADRARAADAHFELTGENAPFASAIVSRLDGIPLAIELAAARVRVLSPQQIAARLDERFRVLTGGDRSALPRRQTLHATIDWSYDLLEPRECVLFARLAIFAGGWSLQAAAEVCGGPGEIDEWEVLDSLEALADKSLVISEPWGDERRYRMLQTMREYGLERLRASGETEQIALRHARFYARWAASIAPVVDALEDEEWKRCCLAELDNLRAAIDWTLFAHHDPATGVALLAQLEWPEIVTSPQEALRWYERAAEEEPAIADGGAYARILRHRVDLEWLAGRPLAQRERDALHAVEAAREANDANLIARALAILGACYRWAGRFDEAEAAFVEAYAHPELLSRLTANVVLRTWAVTDLQRGDVERARRRFLEVVQSERPGSEAHASALLNVGELEYAAGNIGAAREAANRAREAYASLRSVYLVPVLSNLAAYAMAAGDSEDARECLREALEIRRGSGRWLVTVLEHHALFAALQDDVERAGKLLGFTDASYRERGEVRQHTEQRGYARLVELLVARYEAAELESLLAGGARFTEEQAFAEASAIHRGARDPAGFP